MPFTHNPPGAFPIGCKDQDVPAPIVPANLRAGEVDGTVAFRSHWVIPEERTGFRTLSKDAPVRKEPNLVRVNTDCGLLTSVLVVHDKPVIAKVCVNNMDKSQVAATFPALLAFERHTNLLFR